MFRSWSSETWFSKVIPASQADGHEVIAVQYGLDSFEEDVATVKRSLDRVGSPILLFGHSYGGATIDKRVAALVYIAAIAPDAGETVQNQLDKYPSDIFNHVQVADGRAWMLPNGTELFAGDLSEEYQKLVWATHYAPVFDLFHQQKLSADNIAWKLKPSWHVLATQDHTVHPDLQRRVSERMGATVTEVVSSHVPMIRRGPLRLQATVPPMVSPAIASPKSPARSGGSQARCYFFSARAAKRNR